MILNGVLVCAGLTSSLPEGLELTLSASYSSKVSLPFVEGEKWLSRGKPLQEHVLGIIAVLVTVEQNMASGRATCCLTVPTSAHKLPSRGGGHVSPSHKRSLVSTCAKLHGAQPYNINDKNEKMVCRLLFCNASPSGWIRRPRIFKADRGFY